MFRWLRWHLAKKRLASLKGKSPPGHISVSYQGHQARAEEFPPNTEAYEKLASLWDDYGSWFVSGYAEFLAVAEGHYGQPINTLLDLACGTGLVTRQLARRAEAVVGLDASEAMLREARSRTLVENVCFIRADFRDFSLKETFDAAVCSGDSLNYVQTPEAATDVFRSVCRHLRRGGLFVFDVLDEMAFRALNGVKTVVDVDGERFEHYNFYDPAARVGESYLVFEGAVERHRRIPIEDSDVRRAASEAGFELLEHFATSTWRFLVRFSWGRQFYVLRRP